MSRARKRAAPRRKPTLAPLGIELGTREVEDPFEPGARMKVVVNLKESPLDHWRASGHIDGLQFAAGEKFRALWEGARLAGPRGFDFTRPRVDASRVAAPVSGGVPRAMKSLGEVETLLGRQSYRLVAAMVGERAFPADLFPEEAERKYAARRVRDALSEMAELWGVVARGGQGDPLSPLAGRGLG